MPSPDVRTLTVLRDLRRSIADEAAGRLDRWQGEVETPSFAASAANLAQYLAFRHHDLRPLQRELTQHGLSSLGRLESRVMVTLDTAEACLSAAPTGQRAKNWPPAAEEFFRGEMQLLANTQALLGGAEEHAVGRILVTLPTDAAVEREYLLEIARRGADLVRINCAHDQPATWAAMIEAVCEPGDVLNRLPIQTEVSFDDGKLDALVEECSKGALLLRVTRAHRQGFKMKPERGTPAVRLAPARHRRRGGNRAGGEESADIIVRAAGKQPFGVMIARGDLAVAIGFERLAEMQEEILWLCEAAHLGDPGAGGNGQVRPADSRRDDRRRNGRTRRVRDAEQGSQCG